MKTLLFSLSATALLLSAPAYAHEAEPNVQHYEAPEPKTKAEAFEVFETAAKEMEKIGQHAPFSDGDLERIHELSYALENAVETLQLSAKEAAQIHALATLSDVVEEIHEASEEHEESEVKAHLSSLQPAYGKAKTLLGE